MGWAPSRAEAAVLHDRSLIRIKGPEVARSMGLNFDRGIHAEQEIADAIEGTEPPGGYQGSSARLGVRRACVGGWAQQPVDHALGADSGGKVRMGEGSGRVGGGRRGWGRSLKRLDANTPCGTCTTLHIEVSGGRFAWVMRRVLPQSGGYADAMRIWWIC